MTEYEYADLFASFLSAQNSVFANYMTVVFAMLTASWFLAKRLTWRMAAVLLFIYTIWSLNMIVAVWAAFGDFARLGLQIYELGQNPDTSLGWIGPVAAGSADYMKALPTQMAVMCSIVYIASMVFFFIARRRKDD
jgi:hypothetical protein